MSWLRDWCSLHRLGLAVASVAATAVFAFVILALGIVGFAISIAYIAVIGTITVLLRLT